MADVRRSAFVIIRQLIVSLIAGFIVASIGGMLLTPVLWRLEPILKIELAGHSGPSDWVLWTLFGILATSIFALLLFSSRKRSGAS